MLHFSQVPILPYSDVLDHYHQNLYSFSWGLNCATALNTQEKIKFY